jgi:tripartite-type tricarboxylate transporter receptor subunit TctC
MITKRAFLSTVATAGMAAIGLSATAFRPALAQSCPSGVIRIVVPYSASTPPDILARILATGRGIAADPAAAVKWHTIAKASGASDVWLENYMQTIKEADRTAGENAARLWLAHAQPRS